LSFYNTSPMDLSTLGETQVLDNLETYVQSFSPASREIFEELIRRFAESSNETAGEHFTPRDIVRLTTSLVFAGDDDVLTKPGVVRSIYDPTAGTGGFLSAGMEYLELIASVSANLSPRRIGELMGLENELDASVVKEELAQYVEAFWLKQGR
jgi:hypothetical protein